MYSKEDRERILADLGASGLTPRGFSRLPGNPSAAALRRWLRQAELADARMSLEVLKEMVRDPKSGGPARMSNRRKAGLGERLRRECGCPLKDVLAFLRISKSSYEYARRSLERSSGREVRVGERVRSAFEASGRTYGYRRVRAAIAAGADGGEPMAVSEREVRAAMRAGGIEPKRLRFLTKAPDAAPSLLFVEGTRGGKSGLAVEPPLIPGSVEWERVYFRE